MDPSGPPPGHQHPVKKETAFKADGSKKKKTKRMAKSDKGDPYDTQGGRQVPSFSGRRQGPPGMF